MKSIFSLFLFVFAIGISGAFAQTTTTATTTKTDNGLSWDKTTHNFGTVKQNKPAKATFTVTNTGEDALILTNVKSTCGCTAAGYSKDPIPPGESTSITATYNSRKVGNFTKMVRVYTNRSTDVINLTIKGKVDAVSN